MHVARAQEDKWYMLIGNCDGSKINSAGRAGNVDQGMRPKEARNIRVNIRVAGSPPNLIIESLADLIRGSLIGTPVIFNARYVWIDVDASPDTPGARPHEPSRFCFDHIHLVKSCISI